LRQYWYLAAALAAVTALTVYVCFKAYRAVQKRGGERNRIIDRLKYENRLKAEFRGASEQQLLQAEHARLFDGVALLVSEKLEKQKDLNAAFSALDEPLKMIYAAYYLSTDSSPALSAFFRLNGEPLTGCAVQAAERLLDARAAETVAAQYAAFDDNNESVSLARDSVKQLDEAFVPVLANGEIPMRGGEYIKRNAGVFAAFLLDESGVLGNGGTAAGLSAESAPNT